MQQSSSERNELSQGGETIVQVHRYGQLQDFIQNIHQIVLGILYPIMVPMAGKKISIKIMYL